MIDAGSGSGDSDRADGSPEQRRESDAPGRVPDRADYDPGYDPAAPVICEVCGAEMYYTASCKLRCPRCGYTRDCSDP